MRIALIGAAGQLGTDLQRCLPEVLPLTHTDIEITQPEQVSACLGRLSPDLVINTAAYNLVDKAEDEPEQAWAINARGPEILARWCEQQGAALLHVSTDYVYGADAARQAPYSEEDSPGPVGVYGASKLAGEQAVQEFCSRHYVVRTCGLYGQAATRSKGNFVKTMLRLAAERPQLRVVADQHCTPTFTADVARMIAALIQTPRYGLFHVTNAGASSWYEIAAETIRLQELPTQVIPITTADYPTRARRPAYSVLNCSKVEAATGLTLRPWQAALADYLQQISSG